MLISVFDTTICDNNMGNYIIMDSIYKILDDLYPNAYIIKLPYLDRIGPTSIDYIMQSDLVFFGGTNVLSSNMLEYKQWGLDLRNSKKIKKVILLGVGWWQYQGKPNYYTKLILRSVLHKEFIHSARDNYTKEKLASIGFDNVLNTACPSMWGLTKKHCENISSKKSNQVLLTFTNYHRSYADEYIAKIVSNNYKKIYAWVQAPEDLLYAKRLIPNIEIIPSNIKFLDDFLEQNDVDYVGTRLHAGIRALQHKKRAFIIGIDNRALEIKKDFNLPVIDIKDITLLEDIINNEYKTDINLPTKDIERWKNQFISIS